MERLIRMTEATKEQQELLDEAFALSQMVSEGFGATTYPRHPKETVNERAAWVLVLLHTYKVL